MRTQYHTACSLDGFIATPDDSLEWLFPLGDINDTGYPQFIQEVGALAMGATTNEWMLRHVIKPGSGQGVAVRQCGPGLAELRYEVPPRTAAK